MKNWLQEMTWEEVEKTRASGGGVAILPVGSTEQHGRHLPVGCDSFCAIAVAEDAAKKTGALITPPLWFGWSPHHMLLPGTITLRPEILTGVVVDICQSLVHHGFRKIVVINGHRYANLPPLQQAVWWVREKTKAAIRLVDIMLMGDTGLRRLGLQPLGHADEAETSHMLFIHPELVAMNKAVRSPPKHERFDIQDIRLPGDRTVWSPPPNPTGRQQKKRRKISGGVSGDPTRASKEKGEGFHNAVVKNLVELIKNLSEA